MLEGNKQHALDVDFSYISLLLHGSHSLVHVSVVSVFQPSECSCALAPKKEKQGETRAVGAKMLP